MGSRESLVSAPERSSTGKKTEAGTSAPQRPRDPRKFRQTTALEDAPIITGEKINLMIYVPEKHQNIQLKEQKEIIEGIKQRKFKWTYDSTNEEGQIEELLLRGQIKIPKENIVVIPNEIFSKRRSGKTRSPATGSE